MKQVSLCEVVINLRPAQLVALAAFVLAKLLVIFTMISLFASMSYSPLRTPAGIMLGAAGLMILVSVIACIKDVKDQMEEPEDVEL